ncbi:hypothetical protein J2S06_003186 [Bacillus alveayuensis]|uniref:Uncharacterized protein n=1 Tax=Aeribacillus alveayuensis TaxID=279215 RepID=A0ABT9VT65_9BACI|nr:hypothetical protein [Bacillus alveayuensis]
MKSLKIDNIYDVLGIIVTPHCGYFSESFHRLF